MNEKLGEIIFNDKNVFFDYFMMISSVQNYLLDEKNPEIEECENEILSFFNQKKEIFKIQIDNLNSFNSLNQFLFSNNCEKENNSNSNKTNGINGGQDNQKTNDNIGKVYLFNLTEEDNKEKEENIQNLQNEVKSLKQQLYKYVETNMEKGIKLQKKINNMQYELFQVGSRDLWKALVNYNLYQLDIKKEGDYDERIKKIIGVLETYKNTYSDLYKRFFINVKDAINDGNFIAHDFKEKVPIGMETHYIDTLLGRLKMKNIQKVEIKQLKSILKGINMEKILERVVNGGKAVDKYEKKYDIKKLLSTQINK